MKYTLAKDQLLALPLLRPPYQADLDDAKVKEMVRSYQVNPEFGYFKNTIVVAVRMAGQKCFYLVDGQHRVEMCKQKEINYPFDSFKELFNLLENKVSPMKISEFHLTFENKHNLSFITGELSARFEINEFLYEFAVELQENCGFDGKSMFQKLTQRTNCYLEICVEDQESFEPIALAK